MNPSYPTTTPYTCAAQLVEFRTTAMDCHFWAYRGGVGDDTTVETVHRLVGRGEYLSAYDTASTALDAGEDDPEWPTSQFWHWCVPAPPTPPFRVSTDSESAGYRLETVMTVEGRRSVVDGIDDHGASAELVCVAEDLADEVHVRC